MNLNRLTLMVFVVVFVLQISCAGKEKKKEEGKNEDPFTLIVFPDTQIYSKDDPVWRNSSRKEVYMAMTKWVASKTKQDNIKFVLHMGDIVNENYEDYQWRNANEAMSVLDGVVPYTMVVGNHDMYMGSVESPQDSIRNTTNFNQTFPYTRYQNENWYGGRLMKDKFIPDDSFDNSYHFFNQGELEFMIVNLEVGPTNDMLAWANKLIAK